MSDFHIKLKKLLAGDVPITQAKILLGVMFADELRKISVKKRNQIGVAAGIETKSTNTEINKGMALAPFVDVKPEYWDMIK